MIRVERPTLFQIPVCPFSQRVDILLALKRCTGRVDFRVVDITVPRPEWLLELSGGRTAMPLLLMPDGEVVVESLVILERVEALFPDPPIRRRIPAERSRQDDLVALEGPLVDAGYRLVMNRDRHARAGLIDTLLQCFAGIDALLCAGEPAGPYQFGAFGWAEAVFAPIFQRFWFLEYYERFDLPASSRYGRVRRWRDACLAHPAAQQVTREQIVKLYYDYALGAGNGALPDGRTKSTFAFEPHWSERPWPPPDKYGPPATDEALGLVPLRASAQ